VICGVPASGKTTLGSALAHAAGRPLLSSDLVRKRLAGIRPTQRASAQHYSDEFSRHTYHRLGLEAAQAVARHGGVIVDGSFRRRVDRDAFAEACGDAVPRVFVECLAPQSLLTGRARRRDRQATRVSDADTEVVLRESSRWQTLAEVPPDCHLPLRAGRRLEETVEDLRMQLDRRLADSPPHHEARGN
jgi:uncharacterized protein